MGTTIKDLISALCRTYNLNTATAEKLFYAKLAEIGISSRNVRIWLLWEGGLTQQQIAKRLGISQTTTSNVLTRLRNSGFPVSEHKDIPPLGKMLPLNEVDESHIKEKF